MKKNVTQQEIEVRNNAKYKIEAIVNNVIYTKVSKV